MKYKATLIALMSLALAACATGPATGTKTGGDRDDSERPTPNRPVLDY